MRNSKKISATGNQVLLCAPFGKDAQILAKIFSSEGLEVISCRSLKEVAALCSDETDSIFLTEEALVSASIQALEKFLLQQEPWSDIPIVLFASAGARASEWLTRFQSKLGNNANVSIVERPVRTPTILSALMTAKRAR